MSTYTGKPLKSYNAVVFDLFGTLIDFLPDSMYEENSRRMASALGVPAENFRRAWLETALERNLGRFESTEGDIMQVCARIGYTPDRSKVAEAVEIRLEIVRSNHEPRDEAVDTLTALRSLGLKTGIVSDTLFETVRIWPETAFAPLFDAAVFSCAVGICKPDPRIYLHLCRLLSVEPEACLYVGDGSSKELTGAGNVGMTPVLIRVGYDSIFDERRPDALEWKGAVISHLSEILELCS